MGGGNVIFYIFLAIMIVLLIRWSIRVFFTDPKVTSAVPETTRRRARTPAEVRRTTVYTITADPRATDPASNFTDFFWDVAPQTSRSRTDLAKDDKDLPSYDEVMQMEMRQQVIGAEAAVTTTAPVIPMAAVTPLASVTPLSCVTPVTPLTSLTPATPVNIVPVAVTASTV